MPPDSPLLNVLLFLAAAVLAVPVFRFFGVSAVLGYLVAGLAIGPSGFSLFSQPGTLSSVAELGVVMFLFVVGLELKPSTLLSLRQAIVVLGAGQLFATTLLIAIAMLLIGLPVAGAIAIAIAFALSPTAIALQMLEERGALQSDYGSRTFAVLLFQDMAIVPVLALIPLFGHDSGGGDMQKTIGQVIAALGAITAIVLAGRYCLNPMFRALARSGAREVMTAAALLVVLGAAELMHLVGLSAALGAFLAGLLLAESDFRHQIEADIEPFRGLLLGLFFMSVGMTIDLAIVKANLATILVGASVVIVVKLGLTYFLMRSAKMSQGASLRAAAFLAPIGEFAFVLMPLAAANGLIEREMLSRLAAIVALTMFVGPLLVKALEFALARKARKSHAMLDALATPQPEAGGEILVIGFGRFGQVVNQVLLAARMSVTVIDTNVERIRGAARFGFKVYYGDGRRLDVLRAAGATDATLIAICIDDRDAALEIVDLVRHEFPRARVFARAYDRVHAIDLMDRGVDFQQRETSESALQFGKAALVELGLPLADADAVQTDVRRRDLARLLRQREEGILGGADLLHAPRLTPEPLTTPQKTAKGLSGATQALIDESKD